MAEPISAWLAKTAFAEFVAAAFATTAATAATVMTYAAFVVTSAAYGQAQAKRQARGARDAYNASLKDRQVMIRSAIAPRTVVYGRARVSGPIVYAQSTGDKNQFLHLVIALAGHEIDAIEEIYFGDVLLPTPDSGGFINSGPFSKTSTDLKTHGWSSGAVGTLPHTPTEMVSLTRTRGTGEAMTTVELEPTTGYTLSGATVTTIGHVLGDSYVANYSTEQGTPRVRIRSALGGPGDVAFSELVTESGGKWTSAHIGTGVAKLYVRLEYDQDVFGQVGVPEISVKVRGKKVRDPRTGLTVWNDNAALCTADYLRDADLGLGCTAAEVPDAEVIAAANTCDEPVTLTLAGATQKRYTCNGVLSSDAAKLENLAMLLDPMAGSAVWVQGRWLVRAGAYRTPEARTLTEDWLAGPVQILPRASRAELFNAVTGTYIDPARGHAEVQFPSVENPTYRTADGGRRVAREMPMPMVDDPVRAQRIAKIALERARQALTVRVVCNLKAYDIAPTDVLPVSLARYGWSGKAFEVIQREWQPGGGIVLTLRETAAGVFAWNYGEATTVDLAPNTDLPDPYTPPPALADVTVASGTAQLLRMQDGSIITRGLVQWSQVGDVFVLRGGTIEAQWKLDDATVWQSAPPVPGDSVSLYIGPLDDRRMTLVRVRPVNSVGRAGDWEYVTHLVEGKSAAPSNVVGLAYVIKPSQVVMTWNPCEDVDYDETEIRYGATWAGSPWLWRGASSEYQQARPPNGTYKVWVAHRDTSGNYSAAPVSLDITVTDAIDPDGVAAATLLSIGNSASGFLFDSPSATTSSSPTITLDALLVNLTGTVVWTATAFNASNVSLGAVSLGGSGANRTLSAAQFTTYAGTRYVVVTASLGGRSDTVTIYRVDNGSSALLMVFGNEFVTVPTDSTGGAGVYTNARTQWVRMLEGVNDVTALWTFAISTTGGTATINGGTGPVSGTASVDIAFTNMTADSAVVTVTPTRSGYTYIPGSKPFTAVKARAGAPGTPGTAGAAGNNGQSLHRAYRAVTIGSPPTTPGATTSGAIPAGWSGVPLTLTTGQEQYISDGTTPAGSTTTTWGTPYPSYLKVGNLAALAAVIDGSFSTSVFDESTGGSVSRTTALSANTSLGSQIGVFAVSNSVGLQGQATSGYGVVGYGAIGVVGVGTSAGTGVFGRAAGSGSKGVWGRSDGNSSYGGYFSTGGSGGGASNVALYALANNTAHTALRVDGKARFSDQIISELATGTAPFSITSTTVVANLNADLLDGEHASGLAKSIGAQRVEIGNTTTGASTATFNSTNKPGASSTNVWLQVVHGGNTFWVPAWAN